MGVEAVLLVAGAVVAFVATSRLQSRARRAAGRATLFLESLPPLRQRMWTWHDVADQKRDQVQWHLKPDDWLDETEADDAYRQAVLAGPVDARRMKTVRDQWRRAATWLDHDSGPPMDQIIGQDQFIARAEAALESIDDYIAWLEGRAVGWRGRRKLKR